MHRRAFIVTTAAFAACRTLHRSREENGEVEGPTGPGRLQPEESGAWVDLRQLVPSADSPALVDVSLAHDARPVIVLVPDSKELSSTARDLAEMARRENIVTVVPLLMRPIENESDGLQLRVDELKACMDSASRLPGVDTGRLYAFGLRLGGVTLARACQDGCIASLVGSWEGVVSGEYVLGCSAAWCPALATATSAAISDHLVLENGRTVRVRHVAYFSGLPGWGAPMEHFGQQRTGLELQTPGLSPEEAFVDFLRIVSLSEPEKWPSEAPEFRLELPSRGELVFDSARERLLARSSCSDVTEFSVPLPSDVRLQALDLLRTAKVYALPASLGDFWAQPGRPARVTVHSSDLPPKTVKWWPGSVRTGDSRPAKLDELISLIKSRIPADQREELARVLLCAS